MDAYTALKALVARKLGENSEAIEAVGKLEKRPDSAGWRELLDAELGKAKANDDPELVAGAELVLTKLNELPEGERQHVQRAIGNYIAQADRGGTAIVKVGREG